MASDDISGVAVTYYKVDSEDWTQYVEPFTLPNLQDGEHILYFYSVDQLDNAEPTQPLALTIDNTEPHVWFLFPSDNDAINSSNINVAWTSVDYGSGTAYYKIKIDDEEYINKGAFTNHTFSTVAEGSHKLSLRAVDELGNWRELTITLIVDVTPPEIRVATPKNGSEIRSSQVKIMWSGFDELSSVDYYQIRLDENEWVNVSTNTYYVFSKLKDGTHKIVLKAFDKAGNHEEVCIVFSVNTSLLGKPGWTDDIIILSMTGAALSIILVLLFEKRLRTQLSSSCLFH
jgi:hypothetical protein